MIDLDADGARINSASFAAVLVIDFELGGRARTEEAEGVQIAFKISPLTEGIEGGFPLGAGAVIGGFDEGGAAGSLGFRINHIVVLLG